MRTLKCRNVLTRSHCNTLEGTGRGGKWGEDHPLTITSEENRRSPHLETLSTFRWEYIWSKHDAIHLMWLFVDHSSWKDKQTLWKGIYLNYPDKMLSLCGKRKMRQNASFYPIILTWRKIRMWSWTTLTKSWSISFKREILSLNELSPLWGFSLFENKKQKSKEKD